MSAKRDSQDEVGVERFFARAHDFARKLDRNQSTMLQTNAELTTVEAAKLRENSQRGILDDLAKAEFEEGIYDRLPEQ